MVELTKKRTDMVTADRSRFKNNMEYKSKSKKDPSMISSTSTMDVSPVEFKAKAAEKKGDMSIVAKKDVITLPPTTTIMGAIRTMTNKGFRRVPIADAGTKRLEGIITSMDVVNFLGGGSKNLLVKKYYKGNLLAAINADVSEIMQRDVAFLVSKASIFDAVEMMIQRNTGGLPVVNEDNRVCGIFTERDFLELMADTIDYDSVRNYMSTKVKTVPFDATIEDAAKIMVSKGFRRLPIAKDGILIGIVTASNIMNFLGSGKAFEKIITGNFREAFSEPITSLINKDVVWAPPEMDLGDAARLMIEKKVGCLPVIDNDVLCGIITERDLLKAVY
ncbi:MAG: CBS domain-containing protein [Methanomethylovorans sp.]|uniref:CBS domain-containing protein n=1 Tax=Methanomethylovorans sp. TaxID=2758717 RepID=UPI0034586B3C